MPARNVKFYSVLTVKQCSSLSEVFVTLVVTLRLKIMLNLTLMDLVFVLFVYYFYSFGPVHSVRLLPTRRCAFINYTNKESCERAIKEMNVSVFVFWFTGWLCIFLPFNVWKQLAGTGTCIYSTLYMRLQNGLECHIVSPFHNGKQTSTAVLKDKYSELTVTAPLLLLEVWARNITSAGLKLSTVPNQFETGIWWRKQTLYSIFSSDLHESHQFFLDTWLWN